MDELESLIPFYNPTPNIRCKMFEDNRSCIIVAESARLTPGTKHVAIKYHPLTNLLRTDQWRFIPLVHKNKLPTSSPSLWMKHNSSICAIFSFVGRISCEHLPGIIPGEPTHSWGSVRKVRLFAYVQIMQFQFKYSPRMVFEFETRWIK